MAVDCEGEGECEGDECVERHQPVNSKPCGGCRHGNDLDLSGVIGEAGQIPC